MNQPLRTKILSLVKNFSSWWLFSNANFQLFTSNDKILNLGFFLYCFDLPSAKIHSTREIKLGGCEGFLVTVRAYQPKIGNKILYYQPARNRRQSHSATASNNIRLCYTTHSRSIKMYLLGKPEILQMNNFVATPIDASAHQPKLLERMHITCARSITAFAREKPIATGRGASFCSMTSGIRRICLRRR